MHSYHTLLKDESVPELGPALRRMAEHLTISEPRGEDKAPLMVAHVPTKYHRAWLGGEQPREGTSEMQLLFLAKEMENGRRVYREHPSVQWVERS